MYTLEELKAAADHLRTTGNTYLGKTLYEGEGRKVVVLQGFHGSMDRGLAYLVQETVDGERPSPYASIYYLDGLQTGASADLEDYIHKVLPAQVSHWIGQREAREREAREDAQEAERQRFHGFTDGMSPMGKGKVVKILSKRYRFDEGVMTRAERVETMVKMGGHLSTGTNPRGNTEYRIYYQNEWFYTVTKTEYEYFQYLKSR